VIEKSSFVEEQLPNLQLGPPIRLGEHMIKQDSPTAIEREFLKIRIRKKPKKVIEIVKPSPLQKNVMSLNPNEFKLKI
jgi:hypothetical protein